MVWETGGSIWLNGRQYKDRIFNMLYFIMDIACLLYASNIEAYLPPKFWVFSKNPEKDHRNVFALLNVSVRFMKVRYFKL